MRFYKTKRFAVIRNFRVISTRFAGFVCYSVRYLYVFLCGFAVFIPPLRSPLLRQPKITRITKTGFQGLLSRIVASQHPANRASLGEEEKRRLCLNLSKPLCRRSPNFWTKQSCFVSSKWCFSSGSMHFKHFTHGELPTLLKQAHPARLRPEFRVA